MYHSQSSNQLFSICWRLFVASLLFSTAGISIFLWLLIFIFLYEFTLDTKNNGLSQALKSLKTGLETPLIGFVVLVLVSSFYNTGFSKAFFEATWEMRFLIGFYALSYMLKKYFFGLHKKTYQVLLFTVVFCGAYGLAQMIYQIDLIRDTHSHLAPIGNFFRASAFFKVPLTFAYVISMLGIFFYTLSIVLFKNSKKIFLLSAVGFFFSTIGALSSWTRGAWIALAISTLLITYLHNKKLFIKATVIAILATSLLLLNNSFKERFFSIFDMTNYASNTERIDVWRANLAMLADHPILGVGWEQNEKPSLLKPYYEKMNTPNASIYDHAHNDYINIASMTGLPGLFLYLWFCFGFLIHNYFKLRKTNNLYNKAILLGCFGAQIIFYIGGLTQANFTDMEVLHTLFAIWALQEATQV